MLTAAKNGGNAVVIGGGLLGLEAAAGLALKGMKTTVVHLMPTLMERQLDPNAAYLLQKAIEKRGIEVLTEANTNAILGDGKVEACGWRTAAPCRPISSSWRSASGRNMALAKEAGLEVKRGVVVDDHLRTSDENIFAVGECVEHRGQCYGLVAPLYEMAKTLAATLAGEHVSGYTGSATSTKLKVTGVDLFSAGDFAEGNEKDEIVLRDPSRGVYKRVVLRDNRIVGAVLYGDTADGSWYFDLLKKSADVTSMRDTLIFGQAYQGGAAHGSGGRGRGAVGRRGNLRLQRRLQGRDHPGDHGQGPDHARRRSRADQGVVVVRTMHLEGGGAAQVDAGRRLCGRRPQADVQMHRPHA